MSKLIAKIRQYPFVSAIAATILFFVCNLAFGAIDSTFPEGTIFTLAHELIYIIWPLALLFLFGQKRAFRWGSLGTAFKAGVFFLLLSVYAIVWRMLSTPADAWKPAVDIVIGVIALIGIGLREEVIFRGIVTDLIARKYATSAKGVYLTVFGASLLFGALHMQNLLTGAGLLSILVQSIAAFATGSVFCAIYIRGGSLCGLLILHSLFDATSLFNSSFTTITTQTEILSSFSPEQLGFSAVMLVLTLFLLRKKKIAGIIERFQALDNAA